MNIETPISSAYWMAAGILWFVGSILVGVLAGGRARSGPGWLGLSLIISPVIAMIILLSTAGGRVRCEKCAELILPQALVCPDCRAERQPR